MWNRFISFLCLAFVGVIGIGEASTSQNQFDDQWLGQVYDEVKDTLGSTRSQMKTESFATGSMPERGFDDRWLEEAYQDCVSGDVGTYRTFDAFVTFRVSREEAARGAGVPLPLIPRDVACDHDAMNSKRSIVAVSGKLMIFINVENQNPLVSSLLIPIVLGFDPTSSSYQSRQQKPIVPFRPNLRTCVHCLSKFKSPKTVKCIDTPLVAVVIESDGTTQDEENHLRACAQKYLKQWFPAA